MRLWIAAVCLFAAVVPVLALPSKLQPDGALPAPTGVLDLSQPPRERWSRLVDEAVARHTWAGTFQPFVELIKLTIASRNLTRLATTMDSWLRDRFPVYHEEVVGLKDAFNRHGANLSDTLVPSVWQFFGELSHITLGGDRVFPSLNTRACSSIIARATDGTILHGRNDDAGGSGGSLRNLTVDLTVVDRYGTGGIVARATQMLGFIGTYTVLLPGVASLTQDERTLNQWTVDEYINMLEGLPTAGPTPIIMRQAMIDSGEGRHAAVPFPRTFESVKQYLSDQAIGCECYLVLGGVNRTDGAIIARNVTNDGGNETRVLDLGETTPWVPFDWALVETNYDFWEPLPYPSDPRRNVIVSYMASLGQEHAATADGLIQALSIPSNKTGINGVLNMGTIFTVFMSAKLGELQAYIRRSDGCCS